MSIRRTTPRILNIVFAAAALVCVSAFTGCSSFFTPVNNATGGNTGTGFDLVYAGKNNSNSFVGYTIGGTGLTPINGSPFSISSPALSMAITPTDTFLYVGTSTAGIFGYSIAAGGGLAALNSNAAIATTPPSLANGCIAMDVSPDGNWLAVLTAFSSGSANVVIYQITPASGLLTLIQTISLPSITTLPIAHSIKFSPNETMLAAAVGTDGTDIFSFTGSSGAIAGTYDHLTPPVSGDSDNGAIFNEASSTIYIARAVGSLPGILAYYPVTMVSGVASLGAGTFIATGDNPSALSFNTSNATQPYIYVTNANDSSISGYAVTAATPSLQALSTSPYSTLGTGNAPYAIGFDNSSTYMLALNQNGPPDLIQYTVDTTAATAGRLYVTGSATTGLTTLSGTLSGGITMVTSH